MLDMFDMTLSATHGRFFSISIECIEGETHAEHAEHVAVRGSSGEPLGPVRPSVSHLLPARRLQLRLTNDNCGYMMRHFSTTSRQTAEKNLACLSWFSLGHF